jgi:hypothetical protein
MKAGWSSLMLSASAVACRSGARAQNDQASDFRDISPKNLAAIRGISLVARALMNAV